MKKDIKFSTRMASADREKIKALAAKAHMSMSQKMVLPVFDAAAQKSRGIRYKILKAEETIGKGA